MPLGVRDILLVMRAKDEASRTIMGVGRAFGSTATQGQQLGASMMMAGSAMAGAGAGIAAVGAAGLAFFASATSAAMEYNRASALTLTQVDQTGVKLEDIKRIGREVAAAIPAPFEEMQASLFDIFSSMDVGVKQAQTLLTGFAKAAVAGQTDVQTAGRATIAIMNAYELPVSDLNHVLDVQFQLVRKGVGTYEEFATVLGRVIPSAVRAGQSFETTAGAMAFLTRSGQSTAMASTAVARAMDAISHPKSVENMEALGITVKNAAGEFLPMVDIMRQFSERFGEMTRPERAAALTELFKGSGGNIQARRFLNLAVENFAAFEEMVGLMSSGNVAGAMQKAYEIMFDQPASKAQLLKNRYQILKTEIGDQLLPIQVKLMGALTKVLGWWDKLPTSVKEVIVWIGVAVSVFLVISGVILLVAGSLVALIGLFMMLGISLGAVLLFMAVFIVIAALIALAAIAIWKNWGGIRDKLEAFWEDLQVAAQRFLDWLIPRWKSFVEDLKRIWHTIEEPLVNAWHSIYDTVTTIWDDLEQFMEDHDWITPIKDAWHDLEDFTRDAWELIRTVITAAIVIILVTIAAAMAAIRFIWEHGGEQIVNMVAVAWTTIWNTISNILNIIRGIINIVMGLITGDWSRVWEGIKQIAEGIWNQILTFINFFMQMALNIIQFVLNVILAIWTAAWNGLWNAVVFIGTSIWNFVSSMVETIVGFIASLPGRFLELGTSAMNNLWDAISGGAGKVYDLIQEVVDKAGSKIGGLIEIFFDVGANLLSALWNGIKGTIGWLIDKIKGMAGDVIGAVLDAFKIGSPSRVFVSIGQDLMRGLVVGLEQGSSMVTGYLNRFANGINAQASVSIDGFSASASLGPQGATASVNNNFIVATVEQILAEAPPDVRQALRLHLERQ